jgi:2-oxoisovalerate dehydrogenase E1 component
LACLVWHELAAGQELPGVPAWDVNAACSGYLYALGAGFDFLQAASEARVLIVTAEGLSQLVDPQDFVTSVLFGDAATATVLYGPGCADRIPLRLHRPLLDGKGEDGSALSVPLKGSGFIRMDGKKVFRKAVHAMITVLNRACEQAGVDISDLDLVVPHQANGRIIEAVRERIAFRVGCVVNGVAQHGNTSSSSIPLALSDLPRPWPGRRWGLCAFGGGFTSAAAVV